MANVSRIHGFVPSRTGSGAPWNGQLTRYYIPASDSTAIAIGDLVGLGGDVDANGIRSVKKAAIGDPCVGAVVNFEYNMVNLNSPQYRPASTVAYVYVADDPQTVYEAEVSGTFDASAVGQNANHADAGVNTSTGFSGETVNLGTAAVTSTLTLKIMDFVQAPDNEISANAKVLVKINNHQMAPATAGV